jgi:hypothetical protein
VKPEEIISKICVFLNSVGIPHEEGEIEGDTFLPGLQIENGRIKIDRKRLTYPGDLLHEAGHIALTRADLRPTVGQEDLGSQNPAQTEEMGVILWTYLAAKEIGIPAEVIFHAGGYKDQSNWLLDQFENGNFIGLPLLGWMGVTEPANPGATPRVVSWLRVSGE